MATNAPIDVLIHVFDHLDRRIDGRGAAATCRSWNAAWYMSRHWCGDTNDKEVAIPTLRARNADAAIRALTKTGWRATRIALEAVDAALATDVVDGFVGLGRGLESVSTLFASPRHVDATAFLSSAAAAAGPSVPSVPLVPSVPSVPSVPRSLLVHANTSWTYDHRIFNFGRQFAALEHLSIARCTSSVHASSLPPSLRSLEAIECDMLIFDVDLGALEDLTLIDCGGYPIRLRLGQQQQLRTVRVRDTTVELDFFGDRTVRIKPTDSYSMTFEANMMEWRNEDLKFFVHRRSNATTTIDIAAEELHYFLVDPRRTYAFHVGRRDDDVMTIRNVIL